jgi:GDPmannose 4,6-dehydratase
MKAIITGITGQDGSHLADLLLEKNYEVIGVTRRTSSDNTQRIKHILNHPNLKLLEGDVTDMSSILRILSDNADVDEIYNLAAQSHVGTSFKQPALTWDITAKGCLNILESLICFGMFHVRFYQASSSEMFGSSYSVNRDGFKYQDENTKFSPQSPYAIAKCAAHEAVGIYREAYNLHASCGILFNHEGPRRGDKFVTRKITKWIDDFLAYLSRNNLRQQDLTASCIKPDCELIFASGVQESFPKLRLGNLDAQRDWGHAKDYVEAMWLMAQQDLPDDYVICTGVSHSIRDFLDISFEYAGIHNWSHYVFIDPEFYRPAEVDYLRGDCSNAKEKLNWTPKHNLPSLIKDMLQHEKFQSHHRPF